MAKVVMPKRGARVEVVNVNGIPVSPLGNDDWLQLNNLYKTEREKIIASGKDPDDRQLAIVNAWKAEKALRQQVQGQTTQAESAYPQSATEADPEAAALGAVRPDTTLADIGSAAAEIGTGALVGSVASAGAAVPAALLVGAATRYGLGKRAGESDYSAGSNAAVGALMGGASELAMLKGASLLDTRLARSSVANRGDDAYNAAIDLPLGKRAGIDKIAMLRRPYRYQDYKGVLSPAKRTIAETAAFGELTFNPKATMGKLRNAMDIVQEEVKGTILGDRFARNTALGDAGAELQSILSKADDKIAQEFSDEDFGGIIDKLQDSPVLRAAVIPQVRDSLAKVRSKYGLVKDRSKAFNSARDLLDRLDKDLATWEPKTLEGESFPTIEGHMPISLRNYRQEAGQILGEMNASAARGFPPDPMEYRIVGELYHDTLVPGLENFMDDADRIKWQEFRPRYAKYMEAKSELFTDMQGVKSGKSTMMGIVGDAKKFDKMVYFGNAIGVDVVPDLRRAILMDAGRVSTNQKDVPNPIRFKERMNEYRQKLKKAGTYNRVFDESGEAEVQRVADALTVWEPLRIAAEKTTNDPLMDIIRNTKAQDIVLSAAKGGKMSRFFYAAMSRQLSQMSGMQKEAAANIFDWAAMAAGSNTGRLAMPDYPQGPETEPQGKSRVQLLVDQYATNQRPAPELSNQRIRQLTGR